MSFDSLRPSFRLSKTILQWFCALSIAVCLSGLTFTILSERAAASAFRTLQNLSTPDPFYMTFIGDYFQKFSPGDRKMCKAGDLRSDCIAILVIDVPDSKSDLTIPYRRNIVAAGQNVIIIDRTLFDLLLIAANYSAKAGMAASLFNTEGAFETDVLWAQEYTAILRNDHNHGQWIRETANRLKRGVLGFEKQKLPEQFASIPNGQKLFRYVMVAALSVFIEHEIAHLQISLFRRAWLRFASVMRNGMSGASKDEEDSVDAIALRRTDDTLKELLALSPEMLAGGIELAALKANFLFFWTDGMFEFFERLRGLYAEDFLFEINFTSCDLNDDLLQIVPDRVFVMANNLQNGRYKPVPILSFSEYETLRTRLTSVTTHSHSAIRAERLLRRVISRLAVIHKSVDPQRIGLLPGMIESVVRVPSTTNYHLGLKETHLPARAIQLAVASSEAKIEPGYLCPTNTCYVVRQGPTVLELISSHEAVKELRMSFEVNKRSQALDVTPYSVH